MIMLFYMFIAYQLVSKMILDIIYYCCVIINIYNPIAGISVMASPGQWRIFLGYAAPSFGICIEQTPLP